MCHGYHIWSKELLMQVKNDDDLHGGQRSSEVKCGKVCATATIFGQKSCWSMQVKNDDDLHGGQRSTEVKHSKLCYMAIKLILINRWCKFRMMGTFMEVKGHQRPNVVKYVLRLPYLVKRVADQCKLRMMMTFMEVKGQQRSNIVNYATWLSNLFWSTADASLGWWGPSWKSKVNSGQI